jgi:hypothetical protein
VTQILRTSQGYFLARGGKSGPHCKDPQGHLRGLSQPSDRMTWGPAGGTAQVPTWDSSERGSGLTWAGTQAPDFQIPELSGTCPLAGIPAQPPHQKLP